MALPQLLGWHGGAATARTVLSFGFAFLFGTAIGFERQWRQRAAALRTNVLVAVLSQNAERGRRTGLG